MKLQTVPASQGALWVRRGFSVFFTKPLGFCGLFAGFMLAALLLLAVPAVGSLLLLVALPLVSLGFMLATQYAAAGRFPLPTVFIEPLRVDPVRRKGLVQLGLAYALATFVILWLSDLADGGKFDALQEAMVGGKTSQEDLQLLLMDSQLQWGLMLRFGLAALLSLPFWHAPALTHWGFQPWGKALFFSTVACWRNKGAFAVYGLTWFGVILAFSVLASLIFAALGQPNLMAVVAMPAGLMFSTVFYASLYFTYADCFTSDDTPSTIET